MNARTARWIAWFLVAIYFILAGTGLFLGVLTNTTIGDFPIILFIIVMIVIGIWPVLGARIVNHHPRHPVGRLLFAAFPLAAIDIFTIGYASYATLHSLGSLSIPGAMLIWLNWSAQPFVLVAFTLLNLLFPTGRLLSPRWRIVAWMCAGVLPVYLTLQFLEPGPLALLPNLINPYAVSESVWAVLTPFYFLTVTLFLLCSLASVVSLFRRLRRSRGDERQQLKWLVFPAILYWISQPFGFLAEYEPSGIFLAVGVTLVLISVPMMVIAISFAIFKYRLYDIDIIINRTLVYGALTAGIVGLYALVVGSASVVFQTGSNLISVLLATALVVAVFRPLRSRVQRGVDRLLPATVDRPVGKETPSGSEVGERTETLAVSAAARRGVGQERGKAVNAQPESATRLRGRWLTIARLTWFVLMTLTLIVWMTALPIDSANHPGGSPAPSQSGVLQRLPAGYYDVYVGFTAFLMLAYVLLAILIFWRRSDDGFALIVSLAIVSGGASTSWVYHATYDAQSTLSMLNTLVLLLGSGAQVSVFWTFPDGRFVPRWTRPVFILSLLWIILSILFPDEPFSVQRSTGLSLSILLIAFGSMLAGQVYRYKFVSTSVQRQQTKWVHLGFGAVLGLMVVAGLVDLAFPELVDHPVGAFFSVIFWPIVYMILPLTIGFAVLRYRLWDIDIVINRTLVFGALTATIVAMYVLLVGAFGALFRSSDNLLVSLLVTGLAAILFQPLRERLQRAVNRLLYGERDNPLALMTSLTRQLEAARDPEAMLSELVRTVAQALKLPFVAIAAGEPPRRSLLASWGQAGGETQEFPLIYQAETVGHLMVAPRTPGEKFDESEQRLLQTIAGQAGALVQAVRLTNDLKQSRMRIVTAREEERRRLRRDLHDGLGASLAALHLQTGVLKRMIGQDPEAAEEVVGEFRDELGAAIDDIRRVVYELRPPALDELGLEAAIRAQAARCAHPSADGSATATREPALHVRVDAPSELAPLPAAVEVAAYRIVQEALTNVVHHARAGHCVVRLSLKDGLQIEIVDDGRGIADHHHSGMGLVSMRERAAELGGTCTVGRAPEGDTRVAARLPLPQE